MNMQTRISHSDKFFIGGHWVDAASGAKIEVLNAATDEPFATVAEAVEADVARAVAAARTAANGAPDCTSPEKAIQALASD